MNYKTISMLILLLLVSISCETGTNPEVDTGNGGFIADHLTAKESVLRSIPEQYINTARNTLHVAYQHTSHGTHVSRGLFGLQQYKTGDETLFAITGNGIKVEGKLDFNDCYVGSNDISSYNSNADASDLSRNETAFIDATRNFLNDSDNSDVNVIMWSWCDIAGHDVSANYLPGMKTLISEYSEGGSNSRASTTPVTFIFMTGHANANANIGDGKPGNQADLITEFCIENNQYCLDYYGIDTHDMNDVYWLDAGDNGQSVSYGTNFYQAWQDSHREGEDWFVSKNSPGGDTDYGDHNTQYITANRKAYAMWWILARIAGWNGL